MNQFNAIACINTKYKRAKKEVKKALENYINSDQYQYDIEYYGSYTEPIDDYYIDIVNNY